MCILGNQNGWIGDRIKAGITDAFGVPGENDNGRRVLEFCAERGLCMGNTYFKHRSWISTQGWQGAKTDGDKEHDRSGAGEEGYASLYAGCEGIERNGSRSFRSPCGTV